VTSAELLYHMFKKHRCRVDKCWNSNFGVQQGVSNQSSQENDSYKATNQPTKDLTKGGDLREAQVDVPRSI